ncbi:MAG: PIN domain-containing protein [Thermoguttaceae bacterium]
MNKSITMNGKYLIDTNFAIQLFSGLKTVEERLSRNPNMYLSVIVLGELFFGAYRSHRIQHNLEQISELVKTLDVLSCDEKTSVYYGEIKNQLLEKGRPIPENDIWLAALAKQHNLTVITRDRHFQEIEQLDITTW